MSLSFIHLSSVTAYSFLGLGGWSQSQLRAWDWTGVHLDRSLTHLRAETEKNHSHSHSHLQAHLEWSINLRFFWQLKEAWVPVENLRGHDENNQTPQSFLFRSKCANHSVLTHSKKKMLSRKKIFVISAPRSNISGTYSVWKCMFWGKTELFLPF